ncbi:hypothetical protein EB118_09400 [bacterium]|nr:hypothetical protein [bacterium]
MKKLLLIPAFAVLAACSSMQPVEERKTYAQPDWYSKCVASGTEGWFWWSKDYVYACGAGESQYAQAAEEQMYAIAMNNFAKRMNGRVNSETSIKFDNDKRTTRTVISYKVTDTIVRQHIHQEQGRFTMNGRHYTFVRLKMPKDVFERLVEENKLQ